MGPLTAKLAIAQWHGSPATLMAPALPVVPLAHVFGAMAGVIALAFPVSRLDTASRSIDRNMRRNRRD